MPRAAEIAVQWKREKGNCSLRHSQKHFLWIKVSHVTPRRKEGGGESINHLRKGFVVKNSPRSDPFISLLPPLPPTHDMRKMSSSYWRMYLVRCRSSSAHSNQQHTSYYAKEEKGLIMLALRVRKGFPRLDHNQEVLATRIRKFQLG